MSKETISRITDKVPEEMTDWSVRPLELTYAAIFIDAVPRHDFWQRSEFGLRR